MSGMARKLICSVGMASLASDTKLRGKKEVRDELCNQYWAKVLAAEEEALQNVRPWQQLDFVPIHATKEEDIFKPKKGQFLHENYTFGKPYKADVLNNFPRSIRVKIKPLHYPFEPSTEPPPTNNTQQPDLAQWRQAFTQARIYLVGIDHSTPARPEDMMHVMKLIEVVQPDILLYDVCPPNRTEQKKQQQQHLTDAEQERLTNKLFEIFCRNLDAERRRQGLPPVSQLSPQKRAELRQAFLTIITVGAMFMHLFGDEFRAAFTAATQVPGFAGVVLGKSLDGLEKFVNQFNATVRITSIGQAWKYKWLCWKNHRLQYDFLRGRYTDEAAGAKQNELHEKFNQLFPRLGEDFIYASNRNFTRVLHTIAHRCTIEKFCASQREGVPFEPLTVVALVGVGDMIGIINEWAKPEVVYATTKKIDEFLNNKDDDQSVSRGGRRQLLRR